MSTKLGIWGFAIGGVLAAQAIAVGSLVAIGHSPVSGLAIAAGAGIGLVLAAVVAAASGERSRRVAALLSQAVRDLDQGNLRSPMSPAPPPEFTEVVEHLSAARCQLVRWIDEVSRATAGLSRSHRDLAANSERTSHVARGLAGLSGRVLGFASDQTDLLQDAISALTAFDELIRGARDNASETESVHRRTFEVVGTGKESLDKLLDAMADLRNSVHRSADGVVDLSREVLSIGDIVQTVHTIAKKTNLLAINAGIAAAQAGQKGQAFAIIATEIRLLATQTSSALASIQDILLRVQGRTKEVASAIGVGTRRVAEGEVAAKDAGRAIAEARQAMGRSMDQVGEILRVTAKVKGAADRLIERLSAVVSLAEETRKGARMVATQGEDQLRALTEVSEVISALASQTQHIELLVGQFRR